MVVCFQRGFKVVLEARVTLSNRSTLKQLEVNHKIVCLQIFGSREFVFSEI